MIPWATEIKIRAERKVGELLRESAQADQRRAAKNGRPKASAANDALPVLKDLGLTRDQSSTWQKLAKIPEAKRIQARAIQRCSHLLNQIEKQAGKRTDLEPDTAAGTRSQIAKNAGLSKRQYNTTMAVGRIPVDEFDRLVESDDPPLVTALAQRERALQFCTICGTT